MSVQILPVLADVEELGSTLLRLSRKGYSRERITRVLLDNYVIDLDELASACRRVFAARSSTGTKVSAAQASTSRVATLSRSLNQVRAALGEQLLLGSEVGAAPRGAPQLG